MCIAAIANLRHTIAWAIAIERENREKRIDAGLKTRYQNNTHFFLTVCYAYTCKLTKLRFLICIIRYYRLFFFDIDISIFSISQLPILAISSTEFCRSNYY